ncbi:isochorismate lyase [Lysobacter sp. CA199]|uniref:isochorismate lyase n=1 Tax=Lysobacter sp. CA199 TaxID=3455608 RepID=UPI003F8D5D5D
MTAIPILPPRDCRDLNDIRIAIDRIDQDIIQALGLRMRYVEAASAFKPDEASIPAPDRVAAMLPQRRSWAESVNLDGQFVHDLYHQIIHWYIQQQIVYWRSQRELT